MKTSRRDFIKKAGVAGAVLATSPLNACTSKSSYAKNGVDIHELSTNGGTQVFNMSGYAAPKIDKIRVGYTGLGNRGMAAVKRMALIEGVEIVALSDLHSEKVDQAKAYLKELGLPEPKGYADGSKDLWKKIWDNEGLDLLYVATPREIHTEQCVYAMEKGSHVATEIPAARTLDECWALVETSEKTKKHCAMLENCTYDFWELLVLNMTRQGFLGEIVHVDAGYIHDQRSINVSKDMPWRIEEFIDRNGNIYPTHGLGPACQVLNINRGDRIDYLTSMSSDDFTMGNIISELAKEDEYYKKYEGRWKLGFNTSTLKTVNGKTIMLQYNISNPRPYTRIQQMVGTKGITQKYPLPSRIATGHDWLPDQETNKLIEQFTPPLVRLVGDVAKQIGGHGGMDFLMEWRLIDCLRNGLPLDIDVYDAASWSSIVPLSEWSVANNSLPVRMPDFTRGSYEANEPVDIDMKNGGGSTKIKSIVKVEDTI